MSSSAPPGTKDVRDWGKALAIVAGVTVLQLVVGASVPLDGDETYYWDWSRHLDVGYYDHPPLIAYLVAAGRLLFGDTPLGVRLLPILSNTGGMLLVTLLARRIGGAGAGLRAALALACMPIISAWLLLATPDPPMFLANAAALYAVVIAIESPPRSARSLRWWLIAGVALGLSLLSKEMGVLLPFGVLLAMASHRDLRPRLAEPGPYLACLVAIVMFAPVIVWNARHQWAFGFQLQHGLGGGKGRMFWQELDFIGSQVAITGGILFALMVIAVVRAFRSPVSPLRYLLAVVTVTSFGVFALSALRRRVEANWPAAAYTTGILLLATMRGGRGWTVGLRAGYALGAVLVMLIYLHMVVPIFPLHSGGDMIRRGHGWSMIAGRLALVRAGAAQAANPSVWLAGNTFQDASALAFHLPDHPTVFALNLHSRTNQYQWWPQFQELARPGDDLAFIVGYTGTTPGAVQLLEPVFERIQFIGEVGPTGDQPEVPRRGIWLLTDWRGTWPGAASPP